MIDNVSFLLKKNDSLNNIFLDCSIYSISETHEKDIMKSKIKESILNNENLFLITKYESSKNIDNSIVEKSRENLLLSFGNFETYQCIYLYYFLSFIFLENKFE